MANVVVECIKPKATAETPVSPQTYLSSAHLANAFKRNEGVHLTSPMRKKLRFWDGPTTKKPNGKSKEDIV